MKTGATKFLHPLETTLDICTNSELQVTNLLMSSLRIIAKGSHIVRSCATAHLFSAISHVVSFYKSELITIYISLCAALLSSPTPLSLFSSSSCLSVCGIYAKCSQVEDVGFSRNFSRCCLWTESWMCPWGFISGSFPGDWLSYHLYKDK